MCRRFNSCQHHSKPLSIHIERGFRIQLVTVNSTGDLILLYPSSLRVRQSQLILSSYSSFFLILLPHPSSTSIFLRLLPPRSESLRSCSLLPHSSSTSIFLRLLPPRSASARPCSLLPHPSSTSFFLRLLPPRSESARPCSAENAPQGRLTSPLDDISSCFSYREGEMPLTIGLMKTTWQADVPPRGLWGT